MDTLKVSFLETNGQTATDVANRLAAFLSQATQTIDIAVYDFHLEDEPAQIVKAALAACAARGVKIRFVYDSENSSYSWEQGNIDRAAAGVRFIHELGYPARPIPDPCCLMHHKYVILDSATPTPQVWTGSTNFTNASWELQENNIVTIAAPPLCAAYAENFDDLWTTGSLEETDNVDSAKGTVIYRDRSSHAQVHFSPGHGKWLDHEIAVRIEHARERITICAGVLTSGHIISALTEAMTHHIPIDGVYDRTQMEGVRYQWQQVPGNHWKITAFFESLVGYGHLVGKVTIPWSPSSVHNFMHNKIIVVDDTVITGSYNFSRNAESNAENVLIVDSPVLAADYRAYIGHLAGRYGK